MIPVFNNTKDGDVPELKKYIVTTFLRPPVVSSACCLCKDNCQVYSHSQLFAA